MYYRCQKVHTVWQRVRSSRTRGADGRQVLKSRASPPRKTWRDIFHALWLRRRAHVRGQIHMSFSIVVQRQYICLCCVFLWTAIFCLYEPTTEDLE